MTRRAADSTNVEYLPAGMDLYLGYVDGNYRSYDAIRSRFPHALVVPIATQASGNVGTVGDGPPDNGDWSEWVGWVRRRRAAGVDPTIYTDRSSWPVGVQAFNVAGVAQPHWWIADWNNQAEMISGAVAHQYQSVPHRYDLSIVADYWPGVDPAPAAGPPGTGTGTGTTTTTGPDGRKFTDMILLYITPPAGQAGEIRLLSGSLYVHMDSVADVEAFLHAGVPQITISMAQHQAIEAALHPPTPVVISPPAGIGTRQPEAAG